MRFDTKRVAGITGTIAKLQLGAPGSTVADLYLQLNTETFLLKGPLAGNDVCATPRQPAIVRGEWTSVELHITITSGNINLRFATGPRGSPLVTYIDQDMAPMTSALPEFARYTLGYASANGAPDSILFDNIVFDTR